MTTKQILDAVERSLAAVPDEPTKDALRIVQAWVLAHRQATAPLPEPPPNLPQFARWDWTKPNHILSEQHQVPQRDVATARRRLKKPKAYKYAYIDTKDWDWDRPTGELAREHKLQVAVVSKLRDMRGHAAKKRNPVPQRWRVGHCVDWTLMDWSQSNTRLSKVSGVTRERVRQVRAELGHPKRCRYDLKFDAFVEAVKGKIFATAECFAAAGVSFMTGRKYCARLGLPFVSARKACKHPWHLMSWALPNNMLSEIWGINKTLVSSRRWNHCIGKPKWDGRRVLREKPSDYRAALAAEQQEADAWRYGRAAVAATEQPQVAQQEVVTTILK